MFKGFFYSIKHFLKIQKKKMFSVNNKVKDMFKQYFYLPWNFNESTYALKTAGSYS